MPVDVLLAQKRRHVFVPCGYLRVLLLAPRVGELDLVKQFPRQNMRRIAVAGEDVAVFRAGQLAHLRVGKERLGSREEAAVLDVPRIVSPVRVNIRRVLPVMLSHHLERDVAALRRLHDPVPASRDPEIEPPQRGLIPARQPVEALAVPMAHPDPRPVLPGVGHVREELLHGHPAPIPRRVATERVVRGTVLVGEVPRVVGGAADEARFRLAGHRELGGGEVARRDGLPVAQDAAHRPLAT